MTNDRESRAGPCLVFFQEFAPLIKAPRGSGEVFVQLDSLELIQKGKHSDKFPILKVFERKEARCAVNFQRTRAMSKKSDYFTTELRDRAGQTAARIVDELIALAGGPCHYGPFNLLELDRLNVVFFVYQVVADYLTLRDILREKKPVTIRLTGRIRLQDAELIQLLASECDIPLDPLHKAIREKKTIFRDLVTRFYRLSKRLRHFPKVAKSRTREFDQVPRVKPAVLAHIGSKNQAGSIFPVFRELKDKTSDQLVPFTYSPDTKGELAAMTNAHGWELATGSPLNFDTWADGSKILDYSAVAAFVEEIIQEHLDLEELRDYLAKTLVQHLHGRLGLVLHEIRVIATDLAQLPVAILIVLNDATLPERVMMAVARWRGIRSVFIPHAQIGETFINSPIKADTIIAAGKHDREYLASLGTARENIRVTGHPKYDPIFHEYYHQRNSKKVRTRVCARLGLHPRRKLVVVASQVGEEEEYVLRRYLRTVLRSLQAMEDVEVVIKLHPRETPTLVHSVLRELGLRCPVVKDFSLYELIIAADLVIAHRSGVTFECMLLETPSIDVEYETTQDIFEYAEYHATYAVNDPDHIGDAIHEALHDQKTREAIIQGQRSYIKYYLFKFDGQSARRIAQFLEQSNTRDWYE